MTNVSPKNKRVKEKSPEIQRFKALIKHLNIEVVDMAKETGIAERTIMNFIWQDMPIGSHLLRELHSKYNVSLDWLLAGQGDMLLGQGGKPHEPAGAPVENSRTRRMCLFIRKFMESAPDDVQIWLEMQLKIHVPQYLQFLEKYRE